MRALILLMVLPGDPVTDGLWLLVVENAEKEHRMGKFRILRSTLH